MIGAAWIVSAAFTYAAMNGAAKIGAGHLTVWQIGTARFLFGAVALAVIGLVTGLNLWGKHWPLHLVRALTGTAAFLLLIASFETVPISEAMVLFYSWPAFACLLSAWVAGEPTSRAEWPLVGMAFAGAGLILWPHQGGGGFTWGHLLALAGAFIGSVAIILVRRLARDNNAMAIYFHLCLVGLIVCAVPLFFQSRPILPESSFGWWILLFMAVPSLLNQLFMNQGFVYLRAPQVGVLMYLEVLFLAGFGIFWLGEPLTWRLIAGGLLILTGGVALNLLPKIKR